MNDEQRARLNALEQEIAELEAARRQATGFVAQALRTQLDRAIAERDALLGKITQTIAANDSATVTGNYQLANSVINQFFGATPAEDGKTLLLDYLDSLIDDCNQLRLTRLRGKARTGADQRSVPSVRLQDVYLHLTTDGGPIAVSKRRIRSVKQLKALFKRLDINARLPESCAPERVLIPVLHRSGVKTEWREQDGFGLATLREHDDDMLLDRQFVRLPSTFDAIATTPRLVLLGEPGYGKSTGLRYLTMLLARRARGEPVELLGWDAEKAPVPILLPLGRVASLLDECGPRKALLQALCETLDGAEGIRAGLSQYLMPAVRKGGVLLLLDGLDELPAGEDGGTRAIVARAIQEFAKDIKSTIVVTSRVKPYAASAAWQLPAEQWKKQTITPLAFGQVQQFVRQWYGAMVERDPELVPTPDIARQQADDLIQQLRADARLRALVASPLLLTMVTLLHVNTEGKIPRDRAHLFDEIVQLLLERWEPARTPEQQRESRLQQLLTRLPTLNTDALRNVIHRLAFEAHATPPDEDGRGLIDREKLTGRMIGFFKVLKSSNVTADADTFLEVVREEAGLLIARDDESAFTFPHLTFEEFLAACWLADRQGGTAPDSMIDMAYGHWQSEQRDRWRVPLVLLAGRLTFQSKVEDKLIPWLELLAANRAGKPKLPHQRRWDAVLAALSYREAGGSVAFASSMLDIETKINTPLRQAIVDLLATPDERITPEDRVTAATVLGELGDPRPIFPECADFWCDVPAGLFWFGDDREDEPLQQMTLDYSFKISRYPVTNALYQQFLDAQGGQYDPAHPCWTPQGRAFLAPGGHRWDDQSRWITLPRLWHNDDFNAPNQPVVGISWYEAAACCRWLTERERNAGRLTAHATIRLPTSLEWEKAARGSDRRPYPWGEPVPTPQHANYDETRIGRPSPVGCFPQGNAPCGAADMAGNVMEWLATSTGAPTSKQPLDESETNAAFLLSYSSYFTSSEQLFCGARSRNIPDFWDVNRGFRCVQSLAL